MDGWGILAGNEYTQLLSNNLAGQSAKLVKLGIPQLDQGLVFPPPLVDEQAEHNA